MPARELARLVGLLGSGPASAGVENEQNRSQPAWLLRLPTVPSGRWALRCRRSSHLRRRRSASSLNSRASPIPGRIGFGLLVESQALLPAVRGCRAACFRCLRLRTVPAPQRSGEGFDARALGARTLGVSTRCGVAQAGPLFAGHRRRPPSRGDQRRPCWKYSMPAFGRAPKRGAPQPPRPRLAQSPNAENGNPSRLTRGNAQPRRQCMVRSRSGAIRVKCNAARPGHCSPCRGTTCADARQ